MWIMWQEFPRLLLTFCHFIVCFIMFHFRCGHQPTKALTSLEALSEMPRRKKAPPSSEPVANEAAAAAAPERNAAAASTANKKKKEKAKFNEPKIKWKKSKARALLYRDLVDGRVPLDTKDSQGNTLMSYDEVYAMRLEYKLYDRAKFPTRLNTLRGIVEDTNSRKGLDKEAFENFRSNHEPSFYSHKGYPEWQGSEAQKFLLEDLTENRHVGKSYREVWESRKAYFENFPFTPFKEKMRQEIGTAKYLFTMAEKYADQVAS